jgi:hypothetical protein
MSRNKITDQGAFTVTASPPSSFPFGQTSLRSKFKAFISAFVTFNPFFLGSSGKFVGWQSPNSLSLRERVGVRGLQSKRS